ncbi:MAG TPA: hypothetical protein PKE31_11810 [Pseudomonadota bacterium]|nr:hypothetical protein [Pseudomonadota bacterium]
MGNDDRPKLSWREIDKRRAGGTSGSPRNASHGDRPALEQDSRQKQYRAALEAAFAKGELGKLADKLNLSGRGSGTEEAKPVAAPPPSPAAAAATPAATTENAPSEPATPPPASGKASSKKKPGDDKPSLMRKLVEAANRQEISRAAEKYLARFPLPDDHEFLEQLLEHEKEARILEAMVRIAELLDRRHMPRRTRALIGKLRYLTETSANEELREHAQKLLSRLS